MNRTKDNLDSLNNAELRELLAQYGFQSQPITSSTRQVLISRLRIRMQEGKDKLRKTSSYLTRYSSGEDESDRETTGRKANRPENTTTHVTTNMPPPPAVASYKKAAAPAYHYGGFLSSTTVSESNALPTIKVPIQSRASAYIPPPITASDTDEDSDTAPLRSKPSRKNQHGLSYGRLSGFDFPKRYSPQLDTTPPSPAESHLYSQQKRTSPLLFDNKGSAGMLRQRVSTALPSNSGSTYYGNKSPGVADPGNSINNSSGGGEESPYVSDFTKRLLQFRDKTLSQDANNHNTRRTVDNNSVFNQRNVYRGSRLSRFDSEIVHQAQDNPVRRSFSMKTMFRDLFFKLDEQYGVKQTLVPCVLVGAPVLFVLFLIFMYLTISPDLGNALQAKDTKYNTCDSILKIPASMITSSNSKGVVPCIHEEDIESALDLLRLIAPELQRRIELHKCTDAKYPFTLTAREALQMGLSKNEEEIHEIEMTRNLHNMEYLIESNPQWHISHVNVNGVPLTFDEVQQLRPSQTNAFGILQPRLPLSCLFYKKLQTFFFVVGLLAICSGLGYAANTFYKFTVRMQSERQQKTNYFINEILKIVMNQAVKFPHNPDAALIVVNHLRDKLIEPARRREMEAIWTDAIQFLEKNESRVQFEVGLRNGEDCKMIRWIDTVQAFQAHQPHGASLPVQQPVPLAPPSTNQPSPPSNLYNAGQLSQMSENMAVKKWQSPAFDKTNKIESPPTECLKIRQMFDKYEANSADLKIIISDAILEKVGPTCKIFDIQLEKQTCCVYVRCATKKDAGIVHGEINGWWFDNRLVSIKFLKLDRFLNRFPNSTANNNVMRPSNSQKLSLTQCITEPGNRFEDEDDDFDEDDHHQGPNSRDDPRYRSN